jgi:hypothetical protein
LSEPAGRTAKAGEVVVAVHQPNFLPWLGYFDKLARCDVFVLLDTVQFPKKSGTWMNRVRLLVGGEPAWVTIPVVRAYHGLRRIDEMAIDESRPWRRKLLATIEQSYRRARHFETTMPLVTEMLCNDSPLLADYNEAGVRLLASALGLDAGKLIRSSSLRATGASTDLLIDVTRTVGGDCYLAGGGAGEYQEDAKFTAADVRLQHQAFEHPTYGQPSTRFQQGLSVIDALMNCGSKEVAQLLGWTKTGEHHA